MRDYDGPRRELGIDDLDRSGDFHHRRELLAVLVIARVAWGLARSPHPEHRWRRVAVPTAAFVALLAMLTGAGVLSLLGREADRVEGRLTLPSQTPAPTDLWVIDAADDWDGTQFGTYWVGPADDAAPVLPPGLDRLPEPGEAAVSPGLDRLIRREPGLAARYPNRFVFGTDGLRSGDELLAFLRLPPDFDTTSYRLLRIRAFGTPATNTPHYELGTNIYDIRRQESWSSVSGFLLLPALLTLVVGVAAASATRDRRFALLRSIGTSGPTLARLAVVETLVLAAPGLLGAAAAWLVLAPRVARLPLVNRHIVPGDLAIPLPAVLAILLGGTVATAAAALAVVALRHRQGVAAPRPVPPGTTPSLVRLVPMVVAWSLGVLGVVFGMTIGRILIYAGFALAIVAVPVFIPLMVQTAGGRLGKSRSVPAALAGRRMGWDTIRTTRPFAAYGALVVLVLVATAYLTTYLHEEPPPFPRQGPSAAMVSWPGPRPEDPVELVAALGTDLTVPYTEQVSDAPPPGEDHVPAAGGPGMPMGVPTLKVGATCQALSNQLGFGGCEPARPYDLPAGAGALLASLLPGGNTRTVELVDPATIDQGTGALAVGQMLVVSPMPAARLHERLRTAALLTLVAPAVSDWQIFADLPSPVSRWIAGGILAGLTLIALACLFGVIDRLLATHLSRRHLLALGLPPRRLANMEAWLFAVPYTIVGLVGLVTGLAMCWSYLRFTTTPMPWGAVGLIAAASAAVGLAGSAAMALLGARGLGDRKT